MASSILILPTDGISYYGPRSDNNGDIYINEYLVTPFGRKLTINNKIYSREQRTASGRLTREIVATKKQIILSYELIDGDDLLVFLDLYDLNQELTLRIYHNLGALTTTVDPGVELLYDEYTVLMEAINRTRVLLQDNGLWSGVEIELNEV